LCLQEKDSEFGPQVLQIFFEPENIHVTCSASGKMSKLLVKEWYESSLLPSVNQNCVLLLDSWAGYKDELMFESLFRNQINCKIEMIPPKTTALIQPEDVYFFRQWKFVARKIHDRVLLGGIDIDLFHHNNVIKMHSLIHNQISSPRFVNRIKYAWYRSGYLSERLAQFENVKEICFKLTSTNCFQDCSQCSEGLFIICSWCSKPLCFSHFFVD